MQRFSQWPAPWPPRTQKSNGIDQKLIGVYAFPRSDPEDGPVGWYCRYNREEIVTATQCGTDAACDCPGYAGRISNRPELQARSAPPEMPDDFARAYAEADGPAAVADYVVGAELDLEWVRKRAARGYGASSRTVERLLAVIPPQTEAALASSPGAGWRTPEGWVLVPSEPTPEMKASGEAQDWMAFETTDLYAAKVYRAMLAAAPQPPRTDGWRTMDSAPKDGTVVVLCGTYAGGEKWMETGCFDTLLPHAPACNPYKTSSGILPADKQWLTRKEWCRRDRLAHTATPSHWLPTPPQPEGK